MKMSLLLRFATLIIIAVAGFALPVTCIQNGSATAIDIPVVSRFQPIHDEYAHRVQEQTAAIEQVDDMHPFECGRNAPRLADQPAIFETQPFVPGYLDSVLVFDEGRPVDIEPPSVAVLAGDWTDAPNPPPPRLVYRSL